MSTWTPSSRAQVGISYDHAVGRYLQAVGEGAMLPNVKLSACKRGTWHLRNVRGSLAIVTPRGLVMDRIGGQRVGAEPVTVSDLAIDVALAANEALDGALPGETLAQRVHRYEEALRFIGRLADDVAQEHGTAPLRSAAEWEEPVDAPA